MRRITSGFSVSKSVVAVPASFRVTQRIVMSLALLLALALSVFVMPKAAFADQFSGTVIYDQLKVHRSPSSSAPVIGNLDSGTEILLVGRDPAAGWLEAQTPVGDGWVYSPYVAVSPDVMLSSLPITVNNVQPYATVIVYPQINVRSGPSVNFPVVGSLSHGDIVDVIGSDYGYVWLEIQLADGTTGWIPAEYTYLRGNYTNAPNTAGDTQPVVKAVKYLVPIHSAPSATSPVIGSMNQNEYLPVIGSAHYRIWWEVTGDFGTGFVYAPNVLAIGNLANLPVVSN
jgi:uncharacterized protein YraI